MQDESIQAQINGVEWSDEDPTYAIEHVKGTNPADFAKYYNDDANVHVLANVLGDDEAVARIGTSSDVQSASGSDQNASSGTSAGIDQQAVASTGTDGAEQLYSTIIIGDDKIPYVDSYLTETAPYKTAGLWLGSDDTSDGTWGYFIGHNPGLFSGMLNLVYKSPVTVWDSNGHARTYHISTIFDVPSGTTLSEIEDDISNYGESIILQTCIRDGTYYRIMVAN